MVDKLHNSSSNVTLYVLHRVFLHCISKCHFSCTGIGCILCFNGIFSFRNRVDSDIEQIQCELFLYLFIS